MPTIKKGNYRLPAYLLLIMNILGFGLLCMANDFDINIMYIGLGITAFLMLVYTVVILCRMGDKFLILIASMLITIGLLMLCRLDLKSGIKQVVWIGLGVIVFFTSYCIYYNIWFWDKMWFLYCGLGTILFVLTLTLGQKVSGATNWLSIAGIYFQPSEITKILYIMFLACYYSKSWCNPILKIKPKYITAAVTYLFILFLVLQRDWGTILVLFLIYIFMIYIYEKGVGFLLANIMLATVTGLLGYKFLYHIRVRVSVWLNPWEDIANKGYQITQSLFAIASGGYFGRGLGNGSPSYIPEVHTDFIFAAICEEMGVFGGAAVIILFFLFSYRCCKIALGAKNPFNKAVGMGITLMFAFQTFIIIGGVIKFIPLTGITVPFVSYGGTSVIASFMSLGIMQAISAKEVRGEKRARK